MKTSDQLLVDSTLQNHLRWLRRQGVIMVHPEASRSRVALWSDLYGSCFLTWVSLTVLGPVTERSWPRETTKYVTAGPPDTVFSFNRIAAQWELRKNLFLSQTIFILKKLHNELSSGILIVFLSLECLPTLRVSHPPDGGGQNTGTPGAHRLSDEPVLLGGIDSLFRRCFEVRRQYTLGPMPPVRTAVALSRSFV